MSSDTFFLSEATAARRRIQFTAVNSSTGAKMTGISNASFTKRVNTNGTDAAAAGTCVEVSSANEPGVYYYEFTAGELGTLGGGAVVISAASMITREIPFRVIAVNLFDSVRAGMTALPNAAAEAAGGLYTRGTGAGQINQPANGQIDANVIAWRGVLPNVLVSNNVQTHVASMGTDTVSTAAVAAGVTDEIRDSIWNATLASYATAGTAGKKLNDLLLSLSASDLQKLGVAAYGTATAGASTTITLDTGALATANRYLDAIVSIVSGTGSGQAKRITAYTSGRVATVDSAWATNPDATSVYVVRYDQETDAGALTLGTDSITAASVSAAAAAKIATAVGARIIEPGTTGNMTADDSIRFQNAMLGSAPVDWSADAVVIPIKSIDGSKTRVEVVTDTDGRASTETVDLT